MKMEIDPMERRKFLKVGGGGILAALAGFMMLPKRKHFVLGDGQWKENNPIVEIPTDEQVAMVQESRDKPAQEVLEIHPKDYGKVAGIKWVIPHEYLAGPIWVSQYHNDPMSGGPFIRTTQFGQAVWDAMKKDGAVEVRRIIPDKNKDADIMVNMNGVNQPLRVPKEFTQKGGTLYIGE